MGTRLWRDLGLWHRRLCHGGGWKSAKKAASRAIVEAGGTISHQHGVGEDHRQYLSAEKGALGISTLETVFNHLDPAQQMNPGKLLP